MNFIILGPAGSGKGTQAEFLIQKMNLFHIDIGLALREVAQEKSVFGKKIDEIINKKKELVPDSMIKKVLEKKLRNISKKIGVIIDGAPRRAGQIDEVENGLAKFGRKLDKIIYVNIPLKEAIWRISKRYQCSRCDARLVLNKDVKSPKSTCPKCGGKIARRMDDTPAGLKKRFSIFKQETLPVIEHYRKKKILIEVNGKNESGIVFRDIMKKIT